MAFRKNDNNSNDTNRLDGWDMVFLLPRACILVVQMYDTSDKTNCHGNNRRCRWLYTKLNAKGKERGYLFWG